MKTPAEIESPQPGHHEKPVPDATSSGRAMEIGTVFAFVMATGLVAAAARGDLWLDEIWSIMFAASASSPADIFFRFQHDNNHLLNTLYLFWLGKQEVLYLYRLPAIAAGIGSIWLVGIIARKWGKTERLFSLLLAGTSYPLILYFSESRGYAPAIFCALLSFVSLIEERPRFVNHRSVIFSIASVLGILSHATFALVIPALFCLFIVQELHNGSRPKAIISQAGRYFMVPLAFLAGFYFFFIRHIQMGGGPIYLKWDVICRAASLTLGMPEGPLWGPLALACAAAVLAAGTFLLYRDRSPLWVFFPVVLFVAPTLLIALTQPTYLYFRYFIVCIPFFYLLLSYLAAKYYRSTNKIHRWLLVVLILFSAAAQLQRTIPLLQLGRGNYSAAIEYIVSNTETNRIGIGSDHDFRNKVLLAFYSQFLPEPNRLYYIEQADWKKAEPDWIVTHSQNRSYHPPKQLAIPGVGKYRLVKEYRFAGISGWHWFLFRHESKG